CARRKGLNGYDW
nr:immunoglobulin heavy chain junction region [Mus musculus]